MYGGLEHLTFAPFLQQTRTAFVDALADRRRILILGEGDGRFLERLLSVNPYAAVDCVDVSRAMLNRAAERTRHPPRVRFIYADATAMSYPERHYDAVVTLFFLDNFTADTLQTLIPRLAASLHPGGLWLYSDFRLPERGWRRWRARFWLRVMYAFFRAQADIEADRLVDVSPLLRAAGGVLECECTLSAGFLQTQLWRVTAARHCGVSLRRAWAPPA